MGARWLVALTRCSHAAGAHETWNGGVDGNQPNEPATVCMDVHTHRLKTLPHYEASPLMGLRAATNVPLTEGTRRMAIVLTEVDMSEGA